MTKFGSLLRGWLLLTLALLMPAFAQVDLSGVWTPRYHEDQQDRIPGPELGDYLGIPISAAGRMAALSWDASRLTLPEEQCRPHVAPYVYHGPLAFRSWEEKDPETQRLIAVKQYTGTYEQTRTIWMDERPHPPAWAIHTWMGFSTGKWDGNGLTVFTTHIKQDWIRRNGVAESDRATMTEHFLRHGDLLTHVTIIDDPVNLAEPLIRTENFVQDLRYTGTWLYPCEPVVEVANRRSKDVPMYMPDANPFAKEFQERRNVPEIAAMGGVETTYPEFRARLAGTNQNNAAKTTARETFGGAKQSPQADDRELHPLHVRENVWMLVGVEGNVTVQATPKGVLVVDTLTAAQAPAILEQIAKLTPAKIQYIINTSALADHVGGNAILRKAGETIVDQNAPGTFTPLDEAANAAIIAHENVLKRISAPTGKQAVVPSAGWPTSTFFGEDEKSLFFNDEAIRIIPVPASNTDGSVLAFFRRSDVIATGDIFSSDRYPVIDFEKGGSVQGILDGLNKIIDLAVPAKEEEGGTLIIPGHGRLCDRSDVVVYRDMLTIVANRIRKLIERGMTLEQIQSARPTLDYDGLYSAGPGEPGHSSNFVEAVYRSQRSQAR